MAAFDGYCHCKMVGVEVAEQSASGNHLVVEDELSVVTRVYLAQLVVSEFEQR